MFGGQDYDDDCTTWYWYVILVILILLCTSSNIGMYFIGKSVGTPAS